MLIKSLHIVILFTLGGWLIWHPPWASRPWYHWPGPGPPLGSLIAQAGQAVKQGLGAEMCCRTAAVQGLRTWNPTWSLSCLLQQCQQLDSWLPQSYSAASKSTSDQALNLDLNSSANSQIAMIVMTVILAVVPCKSWPSGKKSCQQGTRACQGGKMKWRDYNVTFWAISWWNSCWILMLVCFILRNVIVILNLCMT